MMVIGYDQLPEHLLQRAHLLHVPVDLIALTAHLGIQLVSRSDVPPKVGGILYRGPLWDVIVVNAHHPAVRRQGRLWWFWSHSMQATVARTLVEVTQTETDLAALVWDRARGALWALAMGRCEHWVYRSSSNRPTPQN